MSAVGTDSEVEVLSVVLEMCIGVVPGSNIGKARDGVPVGRVPRGVDPSCYTSDSGYMHGTCYCSVSSMHCTGACTNLVLSGAGLCTTLFRQQQTHKLVPPCTQYYFGMPIVARSVIEP